MARSLSVSWQSSKYILGTDDGIRIRISVDDAEDMPTEVFAYRLLPLAAPSTDYTATFSHVCSPVDLEDYPALTPAANASPPWFRLPYVDLFLRSTKETENLLSVVLDDLRRLKRTLDRMNVLEAGDDIVIS